VLRADIMAVARAPEPEPAILGVSAPLLGVGGSVENRTMTVSIAGADLFYSSRGTGPVCLVLSAVGTKAYERQMPPQLSEGRRLVFVDLRGGGQSTGDPAALTFDQLAADLEAVRADLGVDTVSVIGHSVLGALAIEYGRRCPATVSHVITVGSPPRGDMVWLAGEARQFFAQDASVERKAILGENLAKLPPGVTFDQAFLAQAPTRFYDARTDMLPFVQEAVVNPALFEHLLGALTKDWNVATDAGSLRVPMLLTHGRYDYAVPYGLWDGIVLPTATRHTFQRSGHQPFFEEPEQFAAVVTAWMNARAST
jgi:proline iminopeptidase